MLKEVNVLNINAGAIQDLFDEEFKKIVANINDPNTVPDGSRTITIKVTVKPDKSRKTAVSKVSVASSLQPIKPSESFLYFARTEDGVKVYPDDPAPDLGLEMEEQPANGLRVVNCEK
jgi:hypothetical protein